MITDIFRQNPVRFIERDGKLYVPVIDIARAVRVNKRSLFRIIDKNPAVFSEHEKGEQLETPQGLQTFRCIDKDAATMVLFKISTGHMKDKSVKEQINDFQMNWLRVRMNGVPALPAPAEPDYDGLVRKAKFLKEITEFVNDTTRPMICKILDDAGMGSFGGLLVPQQIKTLGEPLKLPPPKDYMTATDIGNHPKIQKAAHEINMFLYQHKPPLLIKDRDGGYRITPFGKEFGEERYEQFPSGHFGWFSVWKPSVLRLFNVREERV